MKIVRLGLLSGILLAGTRGVAADDDLHPRTGTSLFPILNVVSMNYSAAPLGMGGAALGMPGGIDKVLYNPAIIAFPQKRELMLSLRPVVLDIRATTLGMSTPVNVTGSNIGSIALQTVYLSYGVFDESNMRDKNGQVISGSSLKPYSLSGGLTWARIIWQELAIGVTLKGVYSYLPDLNGSWAADGFACDLGAQYRLYSSRLIFGLALQNAGFVRRGYTSDYDDEPLPLTAGIGLSYNLRHLSRLRVALDLVKPRDNYLTYNLGGQFAIYEKYLYALVGYSFNQRDLRERLRILAGEVNDEFQKSDWSTLSLGISLNAPVNWFDLGCDAAYQFRSAGMKGSYAFSFSFGF